MLVQDGFFTKQQRRRGSESNFTHPGEKKGRVHKTSGRGWPNKKGKRKKLSNDSVHHPSKQRRPDSKIAGRANLRKRKKQTTKRAGVLKENGSRTKWISKRKKKGGPTDEKKAELVESRTGAGMSAETQSIGRIHRNVSDLCKKVGKKGN